MGELYQNKYRIASARKPDWNYGDDAAYFITICVAEMRQEFGYIKNAALVPTPLGELADQHWLGILDKFAYAMLDVHVIMPNHMHGILIIDKSTMPVMENGDSGTSLLVDGLGASNMCDENAGDGMVDRMVGGMNVETRLIASLHSYHGTDREQPYNGTDPKHPSITEPQDEWTNPRGGITGEMNPMLQENLGRILRWYKGRCTFEMRKINPQFKWHGRYWEHIIRDFEEYERIRNYILNNPAKWEADRFYRK
ncbi:MAG: hypothetical protein RLZZ519_1951 [Bacteroidota bacterium]|jgi:REP element-mobilizing transposase RayT